MKKTIAAVTAALLLVLFCVPIAAFAEETLFSQGSLLYRIEDGGVTIVSYVGEDETSVVIPNHLGAYPVSKIAAGAFDYAETVTTVYLPDTIMEVEAGAIPGSIAVVWNYNLNTQAAPDPGTGAIDPDALPTPDQPTGEVIYSNEGSGISIVDETYLYPVEEVEVIEEDEPEPTPEPTVEPTAEPTEGPTATPEATPETETPAAEKSGGAIGWIIGAAVLVCGGAAVVLLRKKGGKA